MSRRIDRLCSKGVWKRVIGGPPLEKSLREAALAYAERGWPVFPVKPGFKTPLSKNGVLNATTNLVQIDKWWKATPNANIGFDVGGANMLVLDYDPGFKLEELVANVGPIPETHLRSRTPRGGEHCFLTLGHDEHVPASTSKLAAHVDVRSFHSYVLLPPSATKDGNYTWIEDGTPAHRTERILHATATKHSKSEKRDEWIIEPDLAENVALATKWLLETAAIATMSKGGEACAYSTAAMLKSYGCSEEIAFDLMVEFWNERCIPPWSGDEIEHLRLRVAHAYQYNTSPPGNMTPTYRAANMALLFSPVVTSQAGEGDETRVAGFRFADREALKHVNPPTWILDNFVPDEAYAMLFGAPTTFKSFLSLDMALTVACDNELETTLWTPKLQGPVLYMAGEGRPNIAKRIKAWEQVHNGGREVPGFVLVDPVPLINITEEKMLAFIKEALRRHPEGYALTFVDTVGKSLAGADENAQQAASAFTLLVDRLRGELGGSVVVAHHSGKDSGRGARGSSLFFADPDMQVELVRKNKSMTVALTMHKQKDSPEWAKPKYVRLMETLVGTSSSLVVVRGQPEEEDAAGGDGDLFMHVLDRVVEEILRANPSRSWTHVDLAEACAMDKRIEVPSKTLNNNHLIRLREDSETVANGCYDPLRNRSLGRWRWREN